MSKVLVSDSHLSAAMRFVVYGSTIELIIFVQLFIVPLF